MIFLQFCTLKIEAICIPSALKDFFETFFRNVGLAANLKVFHYQALISGSNSSLAGFGGSEVSTGLLMVAMKTGSGKLNIMSNLKMSRLGVDVGNK